MLSCSKRTCEIRMAEATEQARRAATAEQIYARALEEFRLRDAECKAAMAAAADAKVYLTASLRLSSSIYKWVYVLRPRSLFIRFLDLHAYYFCTSYISRLL